MPHACPESEASTEGENIKDIYFLCYSDNNKNIYVKWKEHLCMAKI